MSATVTGLFNTPTEAAGAVHTLEARGIPEHEISIMAGENFKKEAFAVDSHSKLPEGVAIGAVAALAAGLTTVGTVATGGAGLLVAGPVVAALAGAGAGAATGGVIGGA